MVKNPPVNAGDSGDRCPIQTKLWGSNIRKQLEEELSYKENYMEDFRFSHLLKVSIPPE